MIISHAKASDLGLAREWLEAARLPVADLTAEHMDDFLIAAVDGRPVGMIGLEQFEHIALLRSLVVDPQARSGGVGRQLVTALEQLAESRNVTDMWLLTTDADRYFETLGYSVAGRDAAPEAIQNTVEFSKLCPGDAIVMYKRI